MIPRIKLNAIYDLTEPAIGHDDVMRVLRHVIDHLKQEAPDRTITARNLIMNGLLEFEVKNVTTH